MFTPRQTPLKEGRSFPGLPNPGPSRRGWRGRQGGILVLLLICGSLIYFLSLGGTNLSFQPQASLPFGQSREYTPDAAAVPQPNPNNPVQPINPNEPTKPQNPNPVFNAPPQLQSPPPAPFEAPPVQPPAEKPKAAEAPAGNPNSPPKGASSKSEPEDEEYTVPSSDDDRFDEAARPKSYSQKEYGGSGQRKTSAKPITFSERPKFERALSRVIDLLPGEMEGRDLLRAVEGTGKEKLREMGLRTRQYKKFFEAWEELHLFFDQEGGTYVRDDVIQYLRYHSHDSSLSDESESPLAQTIHSYEAYRYFLVKFGQLLFPWTAPYFTDHMALHSHFKQGGRGIVLTAGDKQAPYLLTSIPIFRKLGCNLPIEVMYLGDSDLSEDYRSDLEAIDGVITRDIAQMVNDEGWKLAGWAAKPFAILYSSFRETIFIDADSLFFVNPEILFDDPMYKKTGALFFRDRLIMPENKKRWLQQILPKPISRQVKQSRLWLGDSGHQQESGVIVVDKYRHFIALMLVTRMNGPDRDGNKNEGKVGVYDLVYGMLQSSP